MYVEQMMPFVPFVRCRDIDHGIELARHYEHGYRHTSMIHSRDVRNMTKMARAMDTTLFVKNGPCMAALGLGGEGFGQAVRAIQLLALRKRVGRRALLGEDDAVDRALGGQRQQDRGLALGGAAARGQGAGQREQRDQE